MQLTKALAATLLSLTLLGVACSDDNTDVSAGDDTDQGSDDGSGNDVVPDGAPDLGGIITTITPFEPVTEDNDVIGTILVEEDPNAPEGGRKISYTVTSDTKITGQTADGTKVGVFGDLAEGQTADTWVSGDVCAESYPEQCGLEAIRVTA